MKVRTCKGGENMENVLFIDDCTVAIKENMIEYLKKTIEELKEQDDFDNIKDAENLINDISKNAFPFSLIKIGEHVMRWYLLVLR